MGFLDRAANEDEPEQNSSQEELYEKLFPKIGRDFVYKDDLYRIINTIMFIVDPLGLNPIDLTSNVAARKRAVQYKEFLDSGKDGSKVFKDLINLDE